ncbi:hypothetical protein BFP76_02620 [Amylibacter kogurei]|uniref:Chlorhexidine efflux transporter domain-containing protein n=1 Tax=Paramylibacter kogurei TaxID=1889778 RepID=A0A2G5K678_9RHOB|nr:PACE efflux transporter [Amylibacter kogurei]PIB25056.1 hypothetical protein BFP76_02620 [Amylibacter kogurei]
MRTTFDRIRHALSFEIIGLLVITPLGALAFHMPIHDIGIVAILAATLATLWNYIYNLMFDRTMLRIRGSVHKTIPLRIIHAVFFELGLLIVLLPFVAWYLQISLMQALIMDISFALFYLIYAFVFNWAYDLIFPIPNNEQTS